MPCAWMRSGDTRKPASIAGCDTRWRPTNGSVLVIGDTVSPDTAAQHFQGTQAAALDIKCHGNPVTKVYLWKRLSRKIFDNFSGRLSTKNFGSLRFRLSTKFGLGLYQIFEMALYKFARSRRAVVVMAMGVWNAQDSRKGIDMPELSREELERTATHFDAVANEYIQNKWSRLMSIVTRCTNGLTVCFHIGLMT